MNHSNTKTHGPLTGLNVLDLSRILAGPWATQVLADFGAKVWKIENPKGGDDTRQWGQSVVPDDLTEDTDKLTAYYLSVNRGKYSVTVDITSPQGQKIIHALVAKSDILVENYKVGNLKKYGLDYGALSAINPKLIYCSITGFGQTGPYAEQAGYDGMIQASAGLMSITGEPDRSAQKVGVAVSDLMTGMYAVTAVLAALHYRENTGCGQHIDLSLFDTQVGWLANQGMDYLTSKNIPQRAGSAHPSIVPYQPIKASDQPFMLAVGNDHQFRRCCEVIELPSVSDDKRFNTNNHRVQNRKILIDILQEKFQTKSSSYWIELLGKEKIPCGPINNLKQVFEHPQIEARGTCFTLNHPKLGEVPQIANPVKFSHTPIAYHKLAPDLGEDTQQVLADDLNFSQAEIVALTKLNII